MNSRIKEIRKSLNIFQKDFAEKIGLKQSSFSDIENGKAPVTERTIIAICSKFNVNEKWLRTGEGSMFNENNNYNDYFKTFNKLNPVLQDFLITTAKELLKAQDKL